MDHTNQWTTQEINGGLRGSSVGMGMGIMGEMASSSSTSACSLRQAIAIGSSSSSSVGERKLGRPQKDEVQNCPRCHSTNTKFCYYNNYSLTQPRYFCKGCRRYWTAGGTLRNVPVGGGSRKNKHRSSSTSSSSAATSSSISQHKLMNIPDLNPPNHHILPGNPNQDLNLGFPPQSQHHHLYQFELPRFTDSNNHHQQLKSPSPSTASGTNTPTTTTPFAALEFLRSTYSTAPPADTNGIYSSHTSGFSFQELKPATAPGGGGGGGSFLVDDHHGLGSSVGGIHEENGRMLMFPFGGLMKQAAAPSRNTNDQVHHDDHQTVNNSTSRGGHAQLSNSNGFWNGMMGGGGGGSW